VGVFEQSVGKGAFAVVDVGYDAEVADILHVVRRNIFSMCKITHFSRLCKEAGETPLVVCGVSQESHIVIMRM